jgi:predicted amidohydrolase
MEIRRPTFLTASATFVLTLVLLAVAGCRRETTPPREAIPSSRPKAAATRPAAPGSVKVAAVQFLSKMGAPAENRRRLAEKIRQAARNGAKIVVVPEAAIAGYMSSDLRTTWQLKGRQVTAGLEGTSPRKFAETVPGQSTRAFAKLSKQLGIYLTVPLLEVDPKSERFFNALVLAGPEGKLLLHYRKLNPWPWAEQGWTTPGDRGHQYVDTPFGRLALLICYDINFEPQRLKDAKIDTLLYAIAWVDDADSTWFDKQLPDIARQSDMNIIGANWTVPQKADWDGYGHTRVISRTGKILAKVKQDVGEEIIYADLPVPPAAKAKEKGPDVTR